MLIPLLLELAAISMLLLGFVLFAVQLAAREIGFIFGSRSAADPSAAEGVGTVVGGMLGLLAFVLALTLSFASNRFEERRSTALAEANAIGTAWLRAQAVGHPRGEAIADILEEYVVVRRDFVGAGLDRPRVAALNERTGELQTAIWGHATALVRERTDPATVGLMAALNETFDLATAERFAFAQPLPPQMVGLLIGMSLLAMAALGYQLGLRRRPLRLLSALLIGMWTATMTVILDLGAARVGNIQVSTAPYEWTRAGFTDAIRIPPLR
jgi:hypothetical protein